MIEKQFLIGIYKSEQQAQLAVDALIESDYPFDRISVLGKVQHSGDDVLGVVYPAVGERMRVWASHGALWGGLLGALTGATGLFLVPGVGTLLVIGPLVETLMATATGAALGGGTLAGAAALSQVSVALHREGIPEESLEELHDAVEAGNILVILQADMEDDLSPYHQSMDRGYPLRTLLLPASLKG